MKKEQGFFDIRRHLCLFYLAVILCAVSPILAMGQIESVTRLTSQPIRFGRVDFVVMLTAEWSDPFRSDEVRLDLDLTSPSGAAVRIPAYFEKGKSSALSVWKARFTPAEAGTYRGRFVLASGGRQQVSENLSLVVAGSTAKGFLRPADDWSFRFDNGDRFRGLGENICWESRSSDDSRFFSGLHESPRYNYDYMLGQLSAHGGNFFRTWMCPWNLPLEWKKVSNTNRYRDDDGHFNTSAAERMDRLVDLAESLDLYMMLALDNSGNFQGGSWDASSYNRKNGGPVAEGAEFFTDPRARSQYRDRLRYIVARWGYSTHIAAWEFFNEIDNFMYGLPKPMPDAVTTAWHKEMSEYLKSVDPYRHLVTTSISHRDVAGLNRIASIDFNQRHIYRATSTMPEVVRRYSREEGKPYVIGEFAYEWDWNKNFNEFAGDMDRDFKRGLWLGLFSPTPVLPMTWWWEFFDQRGMTPYFARVRRVLDRMEAAGGGSFSEVESRWEGPAAKALAVKCGDSFFILLSNEGSTACTGSLSLPLKASRRYEVSCYDPERDTSTPMASPASGSASVEGVAVPAQSDLILTVSPRKQGRR